MKRSLLIGCGHSREKKLYSGSPEWAGELTTIDVNPDCGADMVFDLTLHRHAMPFEDETFDELAAYDALEHWGTQGDWRGWFDEMAEYWRILKPGGTFGIIVPIGADALSDPGHTRFFHESWFHFLSQAFYVRARQIGSCATDYSWYWKRDFEVLHLEKSEGHHIAVLLGKPL